MVIIGLAREKDRLWLEKLLHRYRLDARPAEEGEPWDIFVDGQGNVRGGGQVITCGLEGHCTLTASSLLQEGGMATLQRSMHTLRGAEVPILTNCPVTGIQPQKNGFIVATKNFTLWAENVLLATGGVSYPKTGSVGDGQNFARTLGHRLVPYQPGLIGMETNDRRVTSLAGRRFEGGRVKVIGPDGATLFDYSGEVDCESFGLSGAAVYNAQRFIAHRRRAEGSGKREEDLTIEVWFDHNRLQFRNLRPRPVKEAIVTIGGVATDEIDPRTMESRLVPHLYFAGEVMDIDGPTGGYNLTMAFATARKAVAGLKLKA